MAHRIAMLVYPDFQLLDATGPLAAFEIAQRHAAGFYAWGLVAGTPGPVPSSAGVILQADPFGTPAHVDTLIVVGGFGSVAAARCPATLRFVRACARRARRVVSICSGAYVLASAGLLDGLCATTHWSHGADFSRRFPQVRLDANRIFVKAGNIWTSPGITAGIDLALALIGEDVGEDIARKTAQQLVVYHRRPGGQSQFSPLLDIERAEGRFAALLDYMRTHLQRRLSVTELANHCCMSPRHFSRLFTAEIGIAPAKAVERLRVDAARAALESGARSIHRVAKLHGFDNAERMRRSFVRVLGSPPSSLKTCQRAPATIDAG
ncbi:GlxA family transcriptional regulator [Luteimonas saliphila]|uniref:GlxA family transcriptional regulator n=1 Tax=Luteimonas saliphila TaxID=2804919 RepID=UPI00192D7309|nr:GlxA family transcriptional regulator [Luteimonas saliphila]